jgi:hypothetical protein
MKQDRSGAKQGSAPVWDAGPSAARPSNFFHPHANAPAMSRRARRAEMRRQRQAKRRIHPVIMAIVLFALFALIGLVGIVVIAHGLR